VRCGLGREKVEALRACEKRPLVSRVLMDCPSLFMHGGSGFCFCESDGGLGILWENLQTEREEGFKARNFVHFGEDN
jgi:hypothetical protein